ncbi:DUF4899 domain-containing protein [Thermosipho ferrireducens]|uniref:DUF4899 domain-containing protein n=1 Tax=Thermosipho ferrireducens TaxID=2571116 RepID=A0ABX7S400_9BACT|nr:DUF4899 domain-containing protein [Thermosipho ferrireducens]QTA37114.1 DUF4899 domain-containing protein [Thermosipho ferrireducens]
MDLYFVKVKGRSKATAEEFIGYFFGKANNAPEYDFIIVPMRFSEHLDSFTMEENIIEFREKLEKLKKDLLEEETVVSDLTLSFNTFLNTMMNKRGKLALGIEFTTAVKENDEGVLELIISNLIEDWSPKAELKIAFDGISLEEYSALTVLEMKGDFEDEEIAKIYKRPDLENIPEFFPVIDPINGVSITKFDIEDILYVVPVDISSTEEKLKEVYPNNFSGSKIKPFPGKIIGKEIIKTKKGNLFLIKIDLGENIIGKFVVSPSLKLLHDETLLKSSKRVEEIKTHGKIKVIRPSHSPVFTGSELLIAFLTTMFFAGFLIIILYILKIL